MELGELALAFGLPAAFVGFCFRRLEKKMDEEKAARAKENEARRQYEAFQFRLLNAITALCKANALALKNGKCNGETSTALAYLDQVKHEYRDYLEKQGIDHLF